MQDEALCRISSEEIRILSHEIRWKIMNLLATEDSIYAKQIAETLGLTEQKVHYHLSLLRNAGLIHQTGVRSIKRGRAKIFKPVANQFFVSLTPDVSSEHNTMYQHIIKEKFTNNGKFRGSIVVGSAEPHGRYDAVSRDGYLAGELCWYLGAHLSTHKPSYLPYFVTTDISYQKQPNKMKTNLILIGGHITNILTAQYNKTLQKKFNIYFVENQIKFGEEIYSLSNHGIIALMRNPNRSNYWILILAGVRSLGTQAAIHAIVTDSLDVIEQETEFASVIIGEINSQERIKSVKKITSVSYSRG